jgi:transposase-like protein
MTRYTASRKQQIIAVAARSRESRDAVMRSHRLSAEELAEWERDFARHGIGGLHSIKNPKFYERDRR